MEWLILLLLLPIKALWYISLFFRVESKLLQYSGKHVTKNILDLTLDASRVQSIVSFT